MPKKVLEVEISSTLHDKLYKIVPDPNYLFRNQEESAYKAIERAVEVALTRFLENLENRARARGIKKL